MKRFLFDSGIASDYVNRRHGVYERARSEVSNGSRIGICTPILAELRFGIELSASRDRNLDKLNRAMSSLTVWPLTEKAAAIYAKIAADLRRAGRPMQVFDMMAAAVALDVGNCTLVSNDSDLAAIPGLKVENWAEASM
jgi:tRNA(fMet)-specific endonuclease VapC